MRNRLLSVMLVGMSAAAHAEGTNPPFDKCAATATILRQQREIEADMAANAGTALLEVKAQAADLQKALDAEKAHSVELQKALDAKAAPASPSP